MKQTQAMGSVMDNTFVFLGPTLPVKVARGILPATYLPPVCAGELCRLVVERRPHTVVIIDGLFERVPAIWHKEILFALERGVRVFGSSSMGALRAAELRDYGMVGVGEVYRAFASGQLCDDDEVAVVHAPAEQGFAVISEAMVNIRHGLSAAVAHDVLSVDSAERLLALAKQMFYPDRCWAALEKLGLQHGLPSAELAALRAFVVDTQPNIKRDDALAVLRLLADAQALPVTTATSLSFERTSHFQRLMAAVAPSAALASGRG